MENIEYKGYNIKVILDENAENPFDEKHGWDGQGKFYHWKEHGKEELEKYCEYLGYDIDTREKVKKEHKDAVIIDKYEHSCIIYTVVGEGRNCRWDTSRAWAVWMPDDSLLDELKKYKGQKRKKKLLEYARQACKLFTEWANGEVYGFKIEDENGNEIEDISCWGYYGDVESSGLLEEAKRIIDIEIENRKNYKAGELLN